MRRLPVTLLLLLSILPGCRSVPFLGGQGNVAACDTGECESCGWCGGLFCVGRHPKYSTILDTLHTRHEARHIAREELRCLDDNACLDCDYRLGFEQAFVDVAEGASGEVPPLPPANFWRNRNRTSTGHSRAQNWFAGYAAGSARAIPIYEPFNVVAASSIPAYDAPATGIMPVTGAAAPEPWQHSLFQ